MENLTTGRLMFRNHESLAAAPQAREEPAAMIQEAQFTDVPTDPAEAARQQAARQRAAEEAYARQQVRCCAKPCPKP